MNFHLTKLLWSHIQRLVALRKINDFRKKINITGIFGTGALHFTPCANGRGFPSRGCGGKNAWLLRSAVWLAVCGGLECGAVEHFVCDGVWGACARGNGIIAIYSGAGGTHWLRAGVARAAAGAKAGGNAAMLPAWGAGIFLGGQPTGINPVARWLR
jgi:hypothetical protein